MRQRKKTLILSAFAVVLIALAGAGVWIYTGQSPGRQADGGGGDADSGTDTRENIPPKTEYTDDEKERLESQTGVTVQEDGTVAVDIGEILAEEESVTITREQACSMAQESLGEGTQIKSAGIREYEGIKYWAVQAEKEDGSYQIWLNADTGEEFINQKDG